MGAQVSSLAVEPLSYTILLEEVLAEKKCPQKHGGFWPEMTPDCRLTILARS